MWDLIESVPDHCLSFYFEFRGRLAEPEFSRQQRVASESLGIQKSESYVRPLFSRPLCESTQCSTPKVRGMASGPLFGGSGCIPVNLERRGLYLFPSFAMIPRCLLKIQQEKATVTLIAPLWQSQP